METIPKDPLGVDPGDLGRILERLGVEPARVEEAKAIRERGAAGAEPFGASRLDSAALDALRGGPLLRILVELGVLDAKRLTASADALRQTQVGRDAGETWHPAPDHAATGSGSADARRVPDRATILYGADAPSEEPGRSPPVGSDDPPELHGTGFASEGSSAGAGGGSRSRLPAPGKIIGRYLLEEELGAGGMGVVFRAFDRELKREVALKLLLAGDGATDDMIQRFQREAQAAAKLSHPNIVRTYDVGSADGRHYLTMELVRGPSLDALVRAAGGKLSPREAMRLIVDVAEALAYAHAQGIVHRDLKPENILLEDPSPSEQGRSPRPGGLPASGVWTGGLRPKITDFGLARIVNMEGEGRLTTSGFIMGTPVYMAPEQAGGDLDSVDGRSDVYSLGAVLYEMVVGAAPYAGSAPIHVVLQKMVEDAPAPRKVNPALAPDVETIIQKAMERDRNKRYAGMREFAEDLRRCLAGEAIQARPISRVERVWRWVRRRPALAGAGAVAAMALAGLGIALFGPGQLRVESDPPGAEVRVNGVVRGLTPDAVAWVWPPGEVEVTLSLPGRLPDKRVVGVGAATTEIVRVSLVRDTGTFSVAVTPATAKIALEQGGREVAVLVGPQEARTLRVGTYIARIHAPDHQEVRTAFEVLPDGEVSLPPVALEHDTARLSIAASLTGGAVWVYPMEEGGEADARPRHLWERSWPEGEPRWRLPLPLEDFAIDTGRYRLLFRKEGSFPRECRLALLSPDATERRNASLTALPLWSRRAGEDVGSSPALADFDGDGFLDVVLGSNDRSVWAFSGLDGSTLWRFETGGRVESSPAVGDLDGDGQVDVVIGSDDGRVYALSGRDGRRLWIRPTTGRVSSSPGLADLDGDRLTDVVVGSWDKQIHALSGRTGEPIWTFATEGGVIGGPAFARLDGDAIPDVLIGSLDGRLYALSGRDGRRLWAGEGTEGIAARPALADLNQDGVPDAVVGTWDAVVQAWSGADGTLLWTYETGAGVNSSAAVADLDRDGMPDFVVGADDQTVHAISGRAGTLLWSVATGGAVLSSPALHDLDRDGTPDVVVGSEDGAVVAVSGTDGTLLWVHFLGERVIASPAVADLDRDGAVDVVVAARDGTVAALRAQPDRLLWALETPRPVTAAPAVADLDGDGTPDVVAGGWDGILRAVSGKDGGLLWRAPTVDRIQAGAMIHVPADDSGMRVLAGSSDGRVRAFRAEKGIEEWSVEVGGPVSSTAAVGDLDGDGSLEVVFGADDRKIYAVSLAEGSIRWSFETGGVAASSPRIRDLDGDGAVEVVVGSGDDRVYALSGRDGSRKWMVLTGGPVTASPALADVNGDGVVDVVIGSGDGLAYALSGRDGGRLWATPLGAPVWSEAAIADFDRDGTPDAAFAGRDGAVSALSGRDGSILWRFRATGRIDGAPAAAELTGDGVPDVVFGSFDRRVYAVDGRDGELCWAYTTGGEVSGSVRLADLTGDRVADVLVGSHDGRLYALDGGAEAGQDPTPGNGLRAPEVAAVSHSLRSAARRAALRRAADLLAGCPAADPLRTSLLRRFVQAALAEGRNAEAWVRLEDWLSLRPAGAEAWLLATIIHARLGRMDEAGKALERGVRADPGGAVAALHDASPWLSREDQARLAGVAANAAARLEPAGEAFPGLLEARAIIRLLAGDGPGADADMTAVLRTGEADPSWYLFRGLARRTAGRRDDALVDFERCFGLPGGVDAWARESARALRQSDAD